MELKGNRSEMLDRLDATFAALSDKTRRAILARLSSGEATVAELAAPFAMTQPAISKHLKVLETAGLIIRNRDAQRRPSRLDARPLEDASKWLAGYREFWKQTLQSRDEVKTKKKKEKKEKKGKKAKHKER